MNETGLATARIVRGARTVSGDPDEINEQTALALAPEVMVEG